jgi:hypothetical protein
MKLLYTNQASVFKPYLLALLFCCELVFSQATLFGEQRIWHTTTIQFDGPEISEGYEQNPFLDYRLNVTFTAPGGTAFIVPGFYAADGNAAETSASSGTRWAVRFTPNEKGNWRYSASFRTGKEVAVSSEPYAGNPVSFDGTSGQFTVAASNKLLPDNRARGRLNYAGDRYLKFEGTKEYFIKVGADSPENLLAHKDFDNAVTNKDWAPHVDDWNIGDPVWKGDKGKGLMGAINYLASKGMNVFSFNMFNLDDPKTNNGGGRRTVWPWSSTDIDLLEGSEPSSIDSRLRYDVSKLEQWEILFAHGDQKGMFMHFKTQERGNLKLLDGGDLGVQRKLYYREIIARFGHHLALNWNLGEEFHIYDSEIVNSLVSYIYEIDPYEHPIVLHSYPGQQENLYRPLIGTNKGLSGVSIQMDMDLVHQEVKQWLEESEIGGHQWIVSNDEQGHWKIGVTVDENYAGDHGTQPDNREAVRHRILWGTLMAGGFGVEYYFGTETGETDWSSENWRSRETKWEDAKIALDFFKTHLNFWEMETNDELTSNTTDYCLASPGNTYAIYLPNGGTTDLDLNQINGNFTVNWFDPRNGGKLLKGSVTTISGDEFAAIGFPPDHPGRDWVALVEREQNTLINVLEIVVSPKSLTLFQGEISSLAVQVTPSDATNQDVIWSSANTGIATVDHSGNITAVAKGTTVITARSLDGNLTDTAVVSVHGDVELNSSADFTIVDTRNDTDLIDMADKMVISLAEIPNKNVNIRANFESAEVESVSISISGPVSRNRIENEPPYMLFGDIDGDYFGQTLVPGSYSLHASAFSNNHLEGTMVSSSALQFTILTPGGNVEDVISVQASNDILVGEDPGFDWHSIKFHPNPADGHVNIQVVDRSTTISKILIYEMDGSLIRGYSKAHDLLLRNGLYKVDISALPTGVYVVKVVTDTFNAFHYRLLVRNE